ncbi:egl nine homolog 1 isoform X1 [Drosophila teissieri]|uniref:egl nine homolog 1 isoform X1 n=1 Tax=Drosophila teissieri TaxID=7243 RepID=UPI001CBA32A1|nr:egl nine homolog 1 isoform X1 [Drosophila teissieri]
MSRGRGKVRDLVSHSGSNSAMDPPRCSICGTQRQLLRCAKCKAVYYCSPAHQHLHWPDHRTECRLLTRQKLYSSNNNKQQQLQPLQQAVASANLEGSGAGANCSTAQMMTPAHQAQSWPAEVDNLLNLLGQPGIQEKAAAAETEAGQRQQQQHHHGEKSSSYQIGLADASFMGSGSERRYEDLCRNIISDMNQYGLSVVDDFLGMETGLKILNEVRSMYNAGAFQDGQVVTNQTPDAPVVRGDKIRGDKIKWVGGNEPGCSNVWYLTNQIDSVVYRVNTMKDNGILGNYHIRERTRAMVACYPGSGTHYVMHVDNPQKDGRVITAIYYLNINWDARESGGILRIRPTPGTTVADIEPKFDRLIFFWSDIRNPHEVQPAHRTRYAITVWYFDAKEREEALIRAKLENSKTNNLVAQVQSQLDSTTTPPAPIASSSSSLPASMSTGTGALNANVSSNSCATSSEICT